jgi:PD-(D/E)XK nuclease superfamily
MENRPNLFEYATKELSQDAFLSWIISWGDNKYANSEPELHLIGQNLIRLLMKKEQSFTIETVKVIQQWQKIDVSVEVNGTHFIVIEDKTSSKAHGTQLANYKDAAKKGYNYHEDNFSWVYLKTGNESKSSLHSVEKEEYTIIGRKEILSILIPIKSKNEIYTDFVTYLTKIENETNDFLNIQKLRSSQRSAQGLYLELENRIKFKSNNNWGWQYVSNQSGGFECFWLNFVELDLCKMYIQIGNAINGDFEKISDITELNKGFNIGVRIELTSDQKVDLQSICQKIIEIGEQFGLDLIKPNVLKTGKTSAVAYLENPLEIVNAKINIDDLVNKIENLINVVDNFAQK